MAVRGSCAPARGPEPIDLGMRPNAPLLISLAALTATPALAQTDPTDPDPGNPEQVERARSVLPRVGTNQTPVRPTRTPESLPKQPGLTEGQDWLQVLNDTLETEVMPSTLAEGSFVLGRLGDLILTERGLVVFVPDAQQREPGEGAVLLMPCRTLEQLEREWSGQRVLLSGEIFSYHGRNQLLISDYRLIRETPAQPTRDDGGDQPADRSEADDRDAGLERDPEVRDLLRELDGGDSSEPGRADDPLDESVPTLPRRAVQTESVAAGPDEGTLLLRRPARLVRNAGGAWTLVFDNDDPERDASVPLIVLPGRTLMKMEQWAMQQGDSARFIVSGRVYSYRGEPYLLATMAQRLGPSDINSIQ